MDLEGLEKIEQELRADGQGLNDRAADAIAWARNEIDRQKTLATQAHNALQSVKNLAESLMVQRDQAWNQLERNATDAGKLKDIS